MYRHPKPKHWQRPRGRKRASKLLCHPAGWRFHARPLTCIPKVVSELDDIVDTYAPFQSNNATLTVPFMPNGVLKTTGVTDTINEHRIKLVDFGQNLAGLALTFADQTQAAMFRLLYPGDALNNTECAELIAAKRKAQADRWQPTIQITMRYNWNAIDIETRDAEPKAVAAE